jgi:hypothetical protein
MSEQCGSAPPIAGCALSWRDRVGAIPAPRGILIGYARCSTERQDLTAQRLTLSDLGVPDDRVYLDHGLSGRNRSRPGLTHSLAALREGDTLVVLKLDRLARSVPDARAIGDSLAAPACACPWAGRSMTLPTQWASASSTPWPRSPSSRSICCEWARASAWRSRARRASTRASRRSSAQLSGRVG